MCIYIVSYLNDGRKKSAFAGATPLCIYNICIIYHQIAQRCCPSRLPSHALATQTHRHGTWCRELDQARQVALFGFNFLLSMLKRIHNTKNGGLEDDLHCQVELIIFQSVDSNSTDLNLLIKPEPLLFVSQILLSDGCNDGKQLHCVITNFLVG